MGGSKGEREGTKNEEKERGRVGGREREGEKRGGREEGDGERRGG